MQQTKSSMFHKLFVALLSAAALFTGTAWLANFRFPLAILQTVGVVDTVRLEGVEWYWYLKLRNDNQRQSLISLYVSSQVLTIGNSNWYSVKQVQSVPKRIQIGPVLYCTSAFDFSPTNPIRDRLTDGTPVARLSDRSTELIISVGFLWPLFAAYPLWSLIRGPLTIRHRRKHGLCLNCGYSLAQLTEPRCPECGCEIELVTSA